ncbi:hypothetical protein [Tardiphaga sp.]|jgi:hypothetical protein|uniref:hypothetical protein n=1 Tax=Tardiphaga sp. TaxID=1926292 RepID=UPI0037DA2B86
MPYKPTGNPPGRPRKNAAAKVVEPAKPLTRARAGFRRAFADPAEALHRPPRWREKQATRRPILHPNVIKG